MVLMTAEINFLFNNFVVSLVRYSHTYVNCQAFLTKET